MKITNIFLVSIIILMILLTGCSTYQYPTEKEPASVEGDTADSSDEFKSEFEKLQKLLEEEGAAEDTAAGDKEEVVKVVEKVDEKKEPAEETEKETETEVEVVEIEEDEEETAEVVEEAEEAETVTTIPTGATKITVKEGELVSLSIKSDDPEGDTIAYTFASPLNSKGKWQTKYGDAGTYKTTITASDGELSTSQDVYIIIEKVNRAPVITNFEDLTVNEGETISLSPKVTDPEGGSVTLEYSGWMTSSKKTTTYDDAGTYKVKLTATSSESEESTEKTITITVKDVNRAPKIVSITNG